jgi:hypothetical protein
MGVLDALASESIYFCQASPEMYVLWRLKGQTDI